jgi:hypothetical protein
MKIIITESQFGILTENKATIDNLVKIAKLSQSDAELLYSVAGKLSMWLAKKIKDKRIRPKIEKITGIIDWIKTGLNGNVQNIKNVDFDELVNMQDRWHKSLKAKDYDFEYFDENIPVLDFRDDSGLGYYWVKLKTNPCTEEAERMGHCGRSGKGDLYSLRVNELKGQTGKVNNKSLVTASIKDGVVYQMKGRFNKKPSEEYYDYIIKLLLKKNTDRDYMIKSFSAEYDSKEDFKIMDLDFSKYVGFFKTRIDLLISDEVLENNDKRLDSLESGTLFEDDEDCVRQAVYQFLTSSKNLEIRDENSSIEYANIIFKLYEESNVLPNEEFVNLLNRYFELKNDKFDFFDMEIKERYGGHIFHFVNKNGGKEEYEILKEEDAREKAINSIHDNYDNIAELFRNKEHYERHGLNLYSFIEISKDEIEEYISDMIWDDPKHYLDKDDYTDKEVYEYIDNEANDYEGNLLGFIRDFDIDETSYFNRDKFDEAVFEHDGYSTLAYYDGEWEEITVCNETYIVYRIE